MKKKSLLFSWKYPVVSIFLALVMLFTQLPYSTGISAAEKPVPTSSLPEVSTIGVPGPLLSETTGQATPDKDSKIKSSNSRVTLIVPKGAVDATADITVTEYTLPYSPGLQFVSYFELKAADANSKASVSKFKQNLGLSLAITQDDLAGLDPASLKMYYLDESAKKWVLLDSNYDEKQGTLSITTNHFSTYSAQANLLQSGPGRVMASEVDLHSGTAMYNYPIELPPGPGGFQPKVELTYNSGVVDDMKFYQSVGSWVGIGWTLKLGSISYDLTSHEYNLEINGASYSLVCDNVHYTTNPEQYFKITRSGNTWEILDKDGYYYRFGGTTDSQQYYGATVYRWDLNLLKDPNNNQVTVSYVQDIRNGYVRSAYPEYLSYSNIQVHFISSFDPDKYNGYYGNLRDDNVPIATIVENRKLDAIEITVGSQLIRKYGFTYNTIDSYTQGTYPYITYYAGKHTLTSITQYGADGTSTLPTMSFTYQDLLIARGEYTPNGYQYVGAFNWPHLVTVNSGYGGSISYSYNERPTDSGPQYVLNIWSKEVVVTKTVNSGIGSNQVTYYGYTGNPIYKGTAWDQKYRGFSQVDETDSAGNKIRHYYYTTGVVAGKDAEILTGKEYKTQWTDSSNNVIEEKDYDWEYVITGTDPLIPVTYSNPYNPPYGYYDITCSNNGFVYITSYYNPTNTYYYIYKCNSSLNHIGIFYNNNTNVSTEMDTDDQNNIYVLVSGNIQKYDSSGTLAGDPFPLQGYFSYLSISNSNILGVSGTQVKKYDLNGNYISSWTLPNYIYDISADSNGYVYVSTYEEVYNDETEEWECNYYIKKYTSSGQYANVSWLVPSTGHISVDQSGNVWFASNYSYSITQYNSSGTYIKSLLSAMWGVGGLCASTSGLFYASGGVVEGFIPNWTVQLAQTDDVIGSKTCRTRYTYDNYGNVVAQYNDGDTSTNTDDSTVWTAYYPNTTTNILDKPARVRTYATAMASDSGGANLKAETDYYYDSNNTSLTTPPTKGNLTRIEQKKDASNSISSYSTYDTYGNKLTEQDANGNTTTYTYDATYHIYPATKTYPISGLAESYTYDPGTNNLLTQSGVNGLDSTTTYTYDTFKRIISMDKPGGRSPDITYEYLAWGTLNQQRILTKTYYDASNYLWQADYFDGVGRVVQTQTNGESGHTIISSTITFNSKGQTDKTYVSQDIASSLSAYYTTGIGSWKYTAYTYDVLGRVNLQTNPDGTTISNDYATVWKTTVTDALTHKKSYYYDAFQKLVKVEELDASYNVYATANYSYDTLGNLTQVVDNSSNTTTITYNWLSQKTSMSDPDMGQWYYKYDSSGNLVSQVDAKAQAINMYYDAMNRLKGKTYATGVANPSTYTRPTDPGTYTISYTYDSIMSGNYGKGQRTGMADDAGMTSYIYDARGRLKEETKLIDSLYYSTNYIYDGTDRVSQIIYPNPSATYPTPQGEIVTQTYNSRGMPNTLSGSTAGTLVSGTSYNSLGLTTVINLGNNLMTTFGYYGTGGTYDTIGGYYGKLWEIKTLPQGGGTAVQDTQYSWDANGNMYQRLDVLASQTETFGYDFLDRLTSVSNAYTQSYTYDAIGNITAMNGNAYTYGDTNHKHAVTAVAGGSSYAYDANGNMTTRGSQTLTWDVENRPVTVSGGASFVYDGDGNRVKKTENGETVLYINKYYEKNLTTSEVTTSYYLGGQFIAQRKGTTLSYIHQDSLSSTSVTTNSAGAATSTVKYFPFGAQRSSIGTITTDKQFTGQRLDSTGLYYYGARYYDATIGRFISPDCLSQIASTQTDMQLELTVSYSDTNILSKLNQALRERSYYKGGILDPQLLNRYTYARNNPMVFNDSSGHWIWAVVGGLVGGLVGLGAYTLTHQSNFDWGQAAVWAGGGALIGATLGAAAPLVLASIAPTASVWAMNAFQRGIEIEKRLGGYMGNFPTIDKFINGVATSIKSVDLIAKSYQNINTLTRLIQGYVNDLASFQGANWGGFVVKGNEITNRVLQLAIPPGASDAQIQAIEQLREWAISQGVEIIINVMK